MQNNAMFESLTCQVIVAILVCVFAVIFKSVGRMKRIPQGLRPPPGPPGLPIIGNVKDMPTYHQWETFSDWAHKYGDLVYIKVLGVSIVIVNSMAIAQDLFEKRSSLYSDRYSFPMMMLMGWDYNFALMKYGSQHRLYRKAFLRNFHKTAVKELYPIQTKWTWDLLSRLKESPDKFASHVHHYAGAVIIHAVYGIQVLPEGDPYMETARKAMAAVEEAANPGSFFIDFLPILKYVPEWVPGAGFKTKARHWKVAITDLAEIPYRFVQRSLDAGAAVPSITAAMLAKYSRDGSISPEDEKVIRATGAVAFGAGSDTTSVALTWFVMAMVLYPEVQRKAQEELDNVLGMDRLPTFQNREQLPYINAICKEIQRWNPIAPLGLAHAVSRDDIYNGHLIPGGSIVIGNSWAMLRDEKLFGPRPTAFEPERFLRPGACDPSMAFGFGRRVCPGRYMADNSIFLAAACILKVFTISHARDKQGNKIPVEVISTQGTVTSPEKFSCSIIPRSGAEILFSTRPNE
ncbi:cytochrome P450 [Ramaria rubella]|nr:cytochrome P450 [Ramaria rubella]